MPAQLRLWRLCHIDRNDSSSAVVAISRFAVLCPVTWSSALRAWVLRTWALLLRAAVATSALSAPVLLLLLAGLPRIVMRASGPGRFVLTSTARRHVVLLALQTVEGGAYQRRV